MSFSVSKPCSNMLWNWDKRHMPKQRQSWISKRRTSMLRVSYLSFTSCSVGHSPCVL